MNELQERALKIAKEILIDKFNDDCIDELENESFDNVMDYIGEVIWEELDWEGKKFDLEVDGDMEAFENMFYELKDEMLKEKMDAHREEQMLADDMRRDVMGR